MRHGTFTNFPGNPGGDINYWVADYKRCCGYKGHWACAHDYPDHMVPEYEFGKYTTSKDGLQPMCRRCGSYRISIWNARISAAERLVGSQKEFRAMTKEERDKIFSQVDKANILNTEPDQEYFDWVDAQKESVVKQRVVSIKSRDSSLPTRMKKEYSYRCQVEKCNESSEVELAHLYPHSRPDSVDNPTNALVLCANHHRALDGHRMCIELDLTFSRYDRGDNQIESGKIICYDWHKIDPKFIKKSQEWFIDDDTKK